VIFELALSLFLAGDFLSNAIVIVTFTAVRITSGHFPFVSAPLFFSFSNSLITFW